MTKMRHYPKKANGCCPHVYSEHSRTALLKPSCTQQTTGELIKCVESDSVDLEWGSRFHIPNKLPGDEDDTLEQNSGFASGHVGGSGSLGLRLFSRSAL